MCGPEACLAGAQTASELRVLVGFVALGLVAGFVVDAFAALAISSW
jgi:hypothetical protein